MARRRNPRKRGVTRGRASATVASTRLTVLDAMQDLELFGPLVGGDSWASWRRCAAAIFGLTTGMTATDRRFIERCLGRRPPPRPAREAWLIIGRRGGKSRFAALVAVFLACVRDYTSVLALGERGVLMVIASDRRQAQVVHGYIAALLHAVPMLTQYIVHETKDAIHLTNGVDRVVAWQLIEFDHVVSLDTSRAAETGGGLLLPFNTGLEYVTLAPSASLHLGALRSWGATAPGARLEIRVGTDDAPDAARFEIAPRLWGQPETVRLPEAVSDQPVSVSFLARSDDAAPIAGGLTIEHPVLVSARRPDTTPAEATDGVTDDQMPSSSGAAAPNVLIYMIDTLRADRLGVYGYDQPTSPNLDALAKDSIVFRHALAQSSWTRPSVASVFTGLHPRSHGVNDRTDALSPTATTLAAVLGSAGYQTAAVVTNGNVSAPFGFHLGFEAFVYLGEGTGREIHAQSDVVNDRVFAWLEGRDADRPFFLYVHTSDPHDPYAPRAPFRDRFMPSPRFPDRIAIRSMHERPLEAQQAPDVARELGALYDAEIAFNDHHLGRLLDHLKAENLYDSTIVLVVSDHGEEFYEHEYWGHGITLYEEQLRVPFVLKLPHQMSAGQVADGGCPARRCHAHHSRPHRGATRYRRAGSESQAGP